MTLKSAGPNLTAEDRVKIIADNASAFIINTQTKAAIYVKTGKEMLRTAANYEEDGSIENAYLLYTRFLTLFVEKIRIHPGYKDVPQAERKLMSNFCTTVMPKAETLKKELIEIYKNEHDTYLREVEQLKKRLELREDKDKSGGKSGENYSYDYGASGYSPLKSGTSSSGGVAFSGSTSKTDSLFVTPSAPPSSVNPGDYMDDEQWIKFNDGVSVAPLPQFDRNTKPSRLLSPIASGLRQVIIPGDLVTKFLQLAEGNNKMNIETCGHLTGRITNEKFLITHLIIPKQKGTADSCTTEHEEELILIQDKMKLLTIGWIHTHPTQTAFLSSVDLHTHFSYQTMLPESIAIVCAPTYNEVGTFTLTPSVGMDIIANCRSEGFHPHPTTKIPLFQEANHTIIDNLRRIEVNDIRFTSSIFPTRTDH